MALLLRIYYLVRKSVTASALLLWQRISAPNTRIMERGEMSRIDLHKLALRMKIVEMLKIHLGRRRLASAPIRWRRLIRPN